MYDICAVTIREVLQRERRFEGWLFVPDGIPLSLDTEVLFVAEDINAAPDDPYPPRILEPCGLICTVEAACVEDIIDNAGYQLENPTPDDLLEALVFYIENDAFKEF